MRNFNLKRSAFTMIELVFVIVVLGILAALSLPRMDRDLKQEAADSILSDIRYTQHLALMDDMHDYKNPKWQQKFWRIVFSTCTGTDRYYMIGSDSNMSSSTNAFFSKNEAATDPSNGKQMFWTNGTGCSKGGDSTVSERIFITNKYGVTNVVSSGGCSNTANSMGHIGFDHLGRPHYGFSQSAIPNYASYITQTCTFKFTIDDGSSFSIDIEPETGYAHIVNQNAS